MDRTAKQGPCRIGLPQETVARNWGMIARQNQGELL